jgi:hypothetical protein
MSEAVIAGIGIAVVLVLLLLSALHLYWLLGGKRGYGAAVPERGGHPTFRPSTAATAAVAVALLAGAGVVGSACVTLAAARS